MNQIGRLLAVLALVFVASAAGAHPGHGVSGQGFGLVHFLTEPVHVVEVLLVMAASGLTWSRLRRARLRR